VSVIFRARAASPPKYLAGPAAARAQIPSRITSTRGQNSSTAVTTCSKARAAGPASGVPGGQSGHHTARTRRAAPRALPIPRSADRPPIPRSAARPTHPTLRRPPGHPALVRRSTHPTLRRPPGHPGCPPIQCSAVLLLSSRSPARPTYPVLRRLAAHPALTRACSPAAPTACSPGTPRALPLQPADTQPADTPLANTPLASSRTAADFRLTKGRRHHSHGAIRARQPQPPGPRPGRRAPSVRHYLRPAGTQPSVACPDPCPFLPDDAHPALRARPVPRHHQDTAVPPRYRLKTAADLSGRPGWRA
jgi:hypothetical protein